MATNLSSLATQGTRAFSYTKSKVYDSEQFDQLTENLAQLTFQYEEMGNQAIKLVNAYGDLNSAAQNRLSTLSSEIEMYGILSIAAVSATIQMMDMVSSLEQQQQQVESFTSGLEQFEKIDVITSAFDQAYKSMVSASDIVQKERQLAQTGLEKASVQLGQELAARLATATAGSMEESTDIIIKLLNAMNIPLEEMSMAVDYVVAQVNKTNLDTKQIAETLKYTAPVFGQMNIWVNEAMGMIGALAQSGLTGSLMGTSIRRILLQLATFQSEWGTGSKIDKYLQQLFPEGLNYFGPGGTIDVIGAFKTMQKNIDNLDVNLAAQMKDLFGQRAIQAVLRLLSTEDGELVISKYVQKITEGAEGYTERKADEMMSTSQQAFKVLADNTQHIIVDAFKPLTNITQSLQNLANSLLLTLRGNTEEAADQLKRFTENVKEQGKSMFNVKEPFGSTIGIVGTGLISVQLAKIIRPFIGSVKKAFHQISSRGVQERTVSSLGLFEPGVRHEIKVQRGALTGKYGEQFKKQVAGQPYEFQVIESKEETQLRKSDIKQIMKSDKVSKAFVEYLQQPESIEKQRQLQTEIHSGFITNAIDRSVYIGKIYEAIQQLNSAIVKRYTESQLSNIGQGYVDVDKNLAKISQFLISARDVESVLDAYVDKVFSGGITAKSSITEVRQRYEKFIGENLFNPEIFDDKQLKTAISKLKILTQIETGQLDELRASTGQYSNDLSKLQEKITKGFDYTRILPKPMTPEEREYLGNIGAYVDPGSFLRNQKKEIRHFQSFADPITKKLFGFSYKAEGQEVIKIKGEEPKPYDMVVPRTILAGKKVILGPENKEFAKQYQDLIESVKKYEEGITYEQLQIEQEKSGYQKLLRAAIQKYSPIDKQQLLKLGITSGEPNEQNLKVSDLMFRALYAGESKAEVRNIAGLYGQVEKMQLAGGTEFVEIFRKNIDDFLQQAEEGTPQHDYLENLKGLMLHEQYGILTEQARTRLISGFEGQENFQELQDKVQRLIKADIDSLQGNELELRKNIDYILKMSGLEDKTGQKSIDRTSRLLQSTIQHMGIQEHNVDYMKNIMKDTSFSEGQYALQKETIFKEIFHGGTEDTTKKATSGIEQFFTLLQGEITKQQDQSQIQQQQQLQEAVKKANVPIGDLVKNMPTEVIVKGIRDFRSQEPKLQTTQQDMERLSGSLDKMSDAARKATQSNDMLLQTTKQMTDSVEQSTTKQKNVFQRIGESLKGGFANMLTSQIFSSLLMFGTSVLSGVIARSLIPDTSKQFSALQSTTGSRITSLAYAKEFDLSRYEREYGVEFSSQEKQYLETIKMNLEQTLEKAKNSGKSAQEIERVEQEYIQGMEQQRQEVLQMQQKRTSNTWAQMLASAVSFVAPSVMMTVGHMPWMQTGNPWLKIGGIGAAGALVSIGLQYLQNQQQQKEMEDMMKQREMELQEKRHQETLQELKRINEDRAQFDLDQFQAQQYITVTVNSSEEAQREIEKWRDFAIGTRSVGYNFINP